jgi:transcriptional regulator
MEFLTAVTKQQQIEWRRSQVLSLASTGYSQREIASKLQVNVRAVNRDIQFLKLQAKENLEKHIHETIPYEYQKAMDSLNQLLRMGWDIVNTTKMKKLNSRLEPS